MHLAGQEFLAVDGQVAAGEVLAGAAHGDHGFHGFLVQVNHGAEFGVEIADAVQVVFQGLYLAGQADELFLLFCNGFFRGLEF